MGVPRSGSRSNLQESKNFDLIDIDCFRNFALVNISNEYLD